MAGAIRPEYRRPNAGREGDPFARLQVGVGVQTNVERAQGVWTRVPLLRNIQ